MSLFPTMSTPPRRAPAAPPSDPPAPDAATLLAGLGTTGGAAPDDDRAWLWPRLAMAATAALTVLAVGGVMALGVAHGVVDAGFAIAWLALALAGVVAVAAGWALGWLDRRREPYLIALQVVGMTAMCAWGYTQLGPLRAVMLPLTLTSIFYGVFTTAPRHLQWIGAWTLAVYAVAIAWCAQVDPQGHPWLIETANLAIVAITVPSVIVLATRLASLRARTRRQREDLAVALRRIEQLATRDTESGLINRRHMHELLHQEYQRSIRSGHPFCVALLALDGPDDSRGPDVAQVFRQTAREAGTAVRAGDLLGRWAPRALVLMMPESRLQLAATGVARVQQHVHGSVAQDWRLVAGIAEHRAGETIEQTLERAAASLERARHGDAAMVIEP